MDKETYKRTNGRTNGVSSSIHLLDELVQVRRLKVPSKSSSWLNFPIYYLSSYARALKVHGKRK